MALDPLCQEMRDACKDSSESQWSVFTVFAVFGRFSHSSFLSVNFLGRRK